MGDLSTLRTLKGALDEGLIAQEDYDTVKLAFIKAQQIKTGVDAGFISEEDYARARDAFLHSLDFRVTGVSSPPQPSAPPAPVRQQPSNGPSVQGKKTPISSGPPSPNKQPAPPKQAAAPTPQHVPAHSNPPPPPPSGQVPALINRPANRPSTAKATSMSGIAVDDGCLGVYLQMKTRSAYEWITFKINHAGDMVIVSEEGPRGSTNFEHFRSNFQGNECKFGVYDYEYVGDDKRINKLVFVHWAPDTAPIKQRMMFASSKDFFKSNLEGIAAELQVTELNELTLEEMRDRVKATMTRT